jgi:hypothetical protein
MAFEEGADRLTCPACGAEHIARWSRTPVREWQLIRCKSCPGILLQMKTVHDYFDLELCKTEGD